jgi:hypothetical protein
VGGVLGGGAPVASRAPDDPFAPPGELTATLEGDHVLLRWKNRAPAAAGCFVEFAVGREEDFTLLDAVGPAADRYLHRDVPPETRLTYRVRPYFGRASPVVELATGIPAPDDVRDAGVDGPLEPIPARRVGAGRSIRTAPAEAAPADLRAVLASATSVDLRWRDRAEDEDGYLVEAAVGSGAGFAIHAFLPRDAASFRQTRLPPAMACAFRVRAVAHGGASNLATVRTSPRPASGRRTSERRQPGRSAARRGGEAWVWTSATPAAGSPGSRDV